MTVGYDMRLKPGPPESPNGDSGPLPSTAEDAPLRTRALLVRTAAWLRLVQLLPCPLALAFGERYTFSNLALATVAYTVQVGWSVAFSVRCLVKGTLPAWVVWVDLLVAAGALVATGRSVDLHTNVWTNPAVGPATGAALAIAVAWWRRRAIVACVILELSYLYGCMPRLSGPDPPHTTAIGNVIALAGFTIIGGIISRLLIRQAETVRSTTAIMLAAREGAAAHRARYDERTRQYRILHDTVLSTLNTIARGADCSEPLLRRRCEAEAAMIRSMISGASASVTSLSTELALVVRDQTALGMRVHTNSVDLPGKVPGEVVVALAGACREALNNVAKHAGTREAWLTCHTDDSNSIVITVVDRGRGFDPELQPPGLGLTRSIAQRMSEVGGTCVVDSQPGEGTCVELKWPR